MKTIPLPEAGITLLPPWWAYVLWAGKRIENRAPSIAGRIGLWRGLFAFGASKTCDQDHACDLAEVIRREPWFKWHGPNPFTAREMFERGGHLVGVAELVGVRPNGDAPADPWAVPGQVGLAIGRVWEIEPVVCSGGRGMCAVGACKACGHIGSIENRGAPLVCRKCRVVTLREHLGRPDLKVVAEFGADGARVEMAA